MMNKTQITIPKSDLPTSLSSLRPRESECHREPRVVFICVSVQPQHQASYENVLNTRNNYTCSGGREDIDGDKGVIRDPNRWAEILGENRRIR